MLTPMIAPNVHCPLHAAFLARWAGADGQRAVGLWPRALYRLPIVSSS
jgi:hypothetical protein